MNCYRFVVVNCSLSAIAALSFILNGCYSPYTIQATPTNHLTATSPLSTVRPPLKFFVPEFTDSRSSNYLYYWYTSRNFTLYPVRDVVLIEPIGSVLTELIRGELRRDGHIVAESASDQVDVVFGGTVREYRSLYQATAFSQDELSGHVKIDVTLQTATVNTPILSKSYKGYYIERRYESDLSAIKNVLDRALLDMLEGITADEELLRVLGALAR